MKLRSGKISAPTKFYVDRARLVLFCSQPLDSHVDWCFAFGCINMYLKSCCVCNLQISQNHCTRLVSISTVWKGKNEPRYSGNLRTTWPSSIVFWRLHRAAFHCFTPQSPTALNAEVHGAGAVNSFHHIWSSSCSWRVALGIGGLQENSSLGPRLQGWNRTQTKSTQRMDIWQKDIGEHMVVDNFYIFIHSHTVLHSSQHILAG